MEPPKLVVQPSANREPSARYMAMTGQSSPLLPQTPQGVKKELTYPESPSVGDCASPEKDCASPEKSSKSLQRSLSVGSPMPIHKRMGTLEAGQAMVDFVQAHSPLKRMEFSNPYVRYGQEKICHD